MYAWTLLSTFLALIAREKETKLTEQKVHVKMGYPSNWNVYTRKGTAIK
jgi:hypothetical protein